MNLHLNKLASLDTLPLPDITDTELLNSKIDYIETNHMLNLTMSEYKQTTDVLENLQTIITTIEEFGIDDSLISLLKKEINTSAFLTKNKDATLEELSVALENVNSSVSKQESKSIKSLHGFLKKSSVYISDLHDAINLELKRVRKLKIKKVRARDITKVYVLPFGDSDKANKENDERLELQNELCAVINRLFNAYYRGEPINDPSIYGLSALMGYKSFDKIFKWNYREINAKEGLMHVDDVKAILSFASTTADLYAGWVSAVKSLSDINTASLKSQNGSKYKVEAVLKQMVTFTTLLVKQYTTVLNNYLEILKNLSN